MLGPAGVWLLLLLVLPTLLILDISLVPGLRLGQPATGFGLANYRQILEPVYLRVMARSPGLRSEPPSPVWPWAFRWPIGWR